MADLKNKRNQELHIVFDSPLKIDSTEIVEAINHWHEAELDVIIKKLKATLKDLKQTPTK